MEITTHVNLQTILCRLFVIPSNLSMKLPLELPFLEHHPPLFTDYLTISYRSVNFCNVSHFSGPAKRQSALRQAWASPHQSPALRATPGTTRKGAAKKNLGGNLSVYIQWMNYCVVVVDQVTVCGSCVMWGMFILSLPSPSPACADTSASDRSMELSEIDARLSALQEFMKKSLASRTQTGVS